MKHKTTVRTLDYSNGKSVCVFLSLVLAILILILSVPSAILAEDITGHLLAYYSFDSDISDDYGSNDLASHGNVQQNLSGKHNGCMEFTAGHLDDTDFDFPNNNNEFTLSFWMWVEVPPV